MPICKLVDIEIFYEDIGFLEPILFLHSHYNRGILAFACQMQAFHKEYRCILPDYRGHGRTISENLDWNAETNAEDMAGLLEALNIEKAHVIGYSCGGTVAFQLAAKYPEKVASLTSIGNSGLYGGETEDDSFLADALIKNGQFDTINEMNRKHYTGHKGDWQGFLLKSQYDANHLPCLSEEEMKGLDIPVLYVAGELDPYFPPEHYVRIKELLPDSEIYIAKGGNHRPHMLCEYTLEVNDIILNFLRKNAFMTKPEGIIPIIL